MNKSSNNIIKLDEYIIEINNIEDNTLFTKFKKDGHNKKYI